MDNTAVRVTPEWLPQVNLARDIRVPVAPAVLAGNTGRHCQELLDGGADTRTKLLNSYFFLIYIQTLLIFLTYIQFLYAL